jgi:phage gpG-like protein
MAGLDLTFSIEGDKQVSRRLMIVADGVTDFTQPLHSIGGELNKTFQLNFDAEGGLFGGWPERVPQYKNGQRVDTWPILQKTGRMRQGFQQNVGKVTLVIFNPVEYFKYHQSNKPRRRLPRRVMMKIDNERADYIVKAFQAYIVGLMRK